MMSPGDEREKRLDEVVADFHRARESGDDPDAAEWIALHPDLAPDLEDHFQMDGLIGWVAAADVPRVPASGARFGPYRILRVIGRGGMGVVYAAECGETGHTVALKVLPSCILADPAQAKKIRREAALLASLDHPHILPILDSGDQAGIPYFAMPRIDGRDLRSVIKDLRAARRSGAGKPHVVLDPSGRLPRLGGPPAEHARAVASIGFQAAGALDHAHTQGVIHRDVKPSNLILDATGTVFATDFGLALGPDRDELTETGNLAGTLRYLPPERLRGWSDPRSDVYSLGLTLYELLALRPAFDSLDRSRLIRSISQDTPRRLRSLDRDIPRDLETIILKAIEKEPSHRYQSAAAMASDLRLFLDGRPIRARRVNALRRSWSWTRRNKARAAGIAIVAASFVAMISAAFWAQYARRMVAEASAKAAESSAEEARFEARLLKIAGLRTGRRLHGWASSSMLEISQSWATRPDERLRDQAAASLAGLDLREVLYKRGLGGGAAAFNADATLLLCGGSEPSKTRDGRAYIYDIRTGEVTHKATPAGPGPVAFTKASKALQLLWVPGTSGVEGAPPKLDLCLWNVAEDRAEIRYDGAPLKAPSALALSPDASLVAASTHVGEKPTIRVWAATSGRHIRDLSGEATSLAFSPTGEMLAAGTEQGTVRVWSLNDCTPPIDLPATENRIQALSFCRDPWCDETGKQGWLLAVGDAGAEVVILDLTARKMRSRCLGSSYEVTALAFSRDGTLLVSGGRNQPRVWDAITGELLVLGRGEDSTTGIAISASGERLASSHLAMNGAPLLEVDSLEYGRGIATLRGLRGPVSKVIFSPDGRRVAAMSHDWRVGVWDLDEGRLLAVLPGPRGFFADNAALAFCPDGRQLAISTGQSAQVWDLDPCRLVSPRSLPPGLSDALAFRSSTELFLCRLECEDRTHHPYDNEFPRVVTLRNLLGTRWDVPIRDLPGYQHLNASVATPDGGRFVLNLTLAGDETRRAIQSVDAATGNGIRPFEFIKSPRGGSLAMDPAGSFLVADIGSVASGQINRLLGLSDLRIVPTTPAFNAPSPARAIGPRAAILVCQDDGVKLDVMRLHTIDSSEALLRLGSDGGTHLHTTTFDRTGRLLAWGRADGLVCVADLAEIHRRLGSMSGLGRFVREKQSHGAVKPR